jgi:L-ascorbate metabolism protein UlaG (beta-lactamase superfamily)
MRVTFLGQSGVALEADGTTVLIDPYLSDLMRTWSRGFWSRAYPVPVPVTEFTGAAAVIATHEHEDHLDPLTVAPLLAVSPQTPFLIPRAARSKICWPAQSRQIIEMRGERDRFQFGPFHVTSLPAAHSADYTLEYSSAEGHRWCGIRVEGGGYSVLHTGDTVDFDGLVDLVGTVDLACVPINGRGRESAGIVGNFDPFEAADFCKRVNARMALALHWDLFPANSGDPALFKNHLADTDIVVHYGLPPLSFSLGG